MPLFEKAVKDLNERGRVMTGKDIVFEIKTVL